MCTHTHKGASPESGHVALPYNLIQTKKLSHIELFVNQDLYKQYRFKDLALLSEPQMSNLKISEIMQSKAYPYYVFGSQTMTQFKNLC